LPGIVVSLAINRLDPIHRQRNGPPILIHFACEEIGAVTVNHVPEAVVGSGEKVVSTMPVSSSKKTKGSCLHSWHTVKNEDTTPLFLPLLILRMSYKFKRGLDH